MKKKKNTFLDNISFILYLELQHYIILTWYFTLHLALTQQTCVVMPYCMAPESASRVAGQCGGLCREQFFFNLIFSSAAVSWCRGTGLIVDVVTLTTSGWITCVFSSQFKHQCNDPRYPLTRSETSSLFFCACGGLVVLGKGVVGGLSSWKTGGSHDDPEPPPPRGSHLN